MGCLFDSFLFGLILVPIFILVIGGIFVDQKNVVGAVTFFIIGVILLIVWIVYVVLHRTQEE